MGLGQRSYRYDSQTGKLRALHMIAAFVYATSSSMIPDFPQFM